MYTYIVSLRIRGWLEEYKGTLTAFLFEFDKKERKI